MLLYVAEGQISGQVMRRPLMSASSCGGLECGCGGLQASRGSALSWELCISIRAEQLHKFQGHVDQGLTLCMPGHTVTVRCVMRKTLRT
jgi:hypothetical protein